MQEKMALLINPGDQVSAEISQILSAPEWTICETPDNGAALSLAQSTRFDFILTSDMSSGREDVQLLRRIRALHPHTRMIILAASSTPADVIEAIREGAFSYFVQPISMPALREMVRSATEDPSWDDGIEILLAGENWWRIAARCDRKVPERLVQFINAMLDLPEGEKNAVGMALSELLMNAIEHGAKFDPGKYVELSYLRTKRAVTCRVKDPGDGFSFDELSHVAIGNPEDDPLRHVRYREEHNMRAGGFGILLAHNSVDELIYSDKGNEVLLIKYL